MTKVKVVGAVEGRDILAYEIGNGKVRARVINLGASVTHLFVPDKNGNPVDVVFGI